MNLISKKDLLAMTGISYGQLYRWKRERLIPEEWFIKQPSYTGQETFLPREQILSRIRSILELKDRYSIEEMAKIFSPETAPAGIPPQELAQFEEIDKEFLALLPGTYPKERYEFLDLVFFAALSSCIGKNAFTPRDAAALIGRANATVFTLHSVDRVLVLFSCGGEFHVAIGRDEKPVMFDTGLEIIEMIHLNQTAEQIKLHHKDRFPV